MKAIYRLLLALILILVILFVPRLFTEKGEAVTGTATLAEVNRLGGVLAVFSEGDGPGLCFLDLSEAALTDREGTPVAVTALRPGMTVEVTWSGGIWESYPSQVSADSLRIISEGEDMLGAHLAVLTALWDENSALTAGAASVLLDPTGMEVLPEEERSALPYLCSCRMGFLPCSFAGTPDGAPDSVFLSLRLREDGGYSAALRRGNGEPVSREYTALRDEQGVWSVSPLK